MLATASFDNTVKLWDCRRRQGAAHPDRPHRAGLLRRLQPGRHDPGLLAATTRPSACGTSRTASCSANSRATPASSIASPSVPTARCWPPAAPTRSVRLWNPADGKEIKNLGDHASFGLRVAFSPDGKYTGLGGGGQADQDLGRGRPEGAENAQGHDGAVTAWSSPRTTRRCTRSASIASSTSGISAPARRRRSSARRRTTCTASPSRATASNWRRWLRRQGDDVEPGGRQAGVHQEIEAGGVHADVHPGRQGCGDGPRRCRRRQRLLPDYADCAVTVCFDLPTSRKRQRRVWLNPSLTLPARQCCQNHLRLVDDIPQRLAGHEAADVVQQQTARCRSAMRGE